MSEFIYKGSPPVNTADKLHNGHGSDGLTAFANTPHALSSNAQLCSDDTQNLH